MAVVSPIQLPTFGAPLADFEAMAQLLNTIALTVDQVEQACRELGVSSESPSDLAKLVEFARWKRLNPPEVAALALQVRAQQLIDSISGGIDIRTALPDGYEAITLGPIYPGDLGCFPVPEDEA